MNKSICDFSMCCEQKTDLLSKIRGKSNKIIFDWVNLLHNSYYDAKTKEQNNERLATSTVASLMMDAIETLDGISILHYEGAINASYPLVRKLMELELQIKFLLNGDSENKALAYEAFYVSHNLSGGENPKNIYKDNLKYKAYKEEADKVFFKEGRPIYINWYQIYDFVEHKDESGKQKNKQIYSIQDIIKSISNNTNMQLSYKKIYSKISQDVHGFSSRGIIKMGNNINYIESYRSPVGTYFQLKICEHLIYEIYLDFRRYYNLSIRLDNNKVNALIEEIKYLEGEWKSQDDKKIKKMDASNWS